MAKRRRARVLVETLVMGAVMFGSAALGVGSGVANAEDAPQPQGDPIAIYKQAGIDQTQEKTILGLVGAYEQTEDAKAHKLIGYLKQMRALSQNPDLDEKAILQTQSGINKLQNEMAIDKAHLLINIRRVLNRNQRIRLVSLIQNKSASDNANVPSH